MNKKEKSRDLWQFRAAKDVKYWERMVLLSFVVAGIGSIFRFADWWFRAEHVGNLWLYLLLSATFWYGMLRLVLIWINYLGISKLAPVAAPAGLRVAIFTTSSPGEPLEMFEKTLAACRNITYPHTTYLLDDTRDARFRDVAEKNGAVWLELVGFSGAKAGKINAALQRTDEDFILVLDPDHIPFPNFLDHTLGFFNDPKIGFVQVTQAYYNQYRSFTARGAAEQTYTFYGPTQMSLHGYGCAVAIGANCTFRRNALTSIGGHGIGLAEDLITSIRLHAAGWKSVYNPVIVSRGLVPEDLGSFCKQQLKWSRGVFEVTFSELPRLFWKLSFWQKLSYLTIGTYYFVGVTQFLFMIIPFLYFFINITPAEMSFVDFVVKGFPIVVISVAIYLFVQRWMSHPATERGLHTSGMILKFACWRVFLKGFLLSLIDAEIPYIPTAKQAVRGYFTPFARTHLWHIGLFVVTIVGVFWSRKFYMPESELVITAEQTWGMMAFAFISFSLAVGSVFAALEARNLTQEDPWDNVNLDDIKIK